MKRRFLFLVMVVGFVCLNPVPALAQSWGGWWDSWYEYEYSSYYYEEDRSGPIYYYRYRSVPLVIGLGGCHSEYDD